MLESVEFSHVLIFFMAMFIVFQVGLIVVMPRSFRRMMFVSFSLQAVNVGLASGRIKKRWSAFANESKIEIFSKFPDYESIETIKKWDDERWAMLRWIILKAIFLRFHEKELIQKHIQREELQKHGKDLKTEEEEEEAEEERRKRRGHAHEEHEHGHEEEGHRARTPEEVEVSRILEFACNLSLCRTPRSSKGSITPSI